MVSRPIERDKSSKIIKSAIPQSSCSTTPSDCRAPLAILVFSISSSDYVVIIDGHCEIPTTRYFHELVDAFEESGADCLGRPQPLDISDATPLQKAIALARSSRLGHHPESFIYSNEAQFVPAKSVAVAYRRRLFDQVGMFDETFDAHEDGEFNYRCDQAGLKCYLAPKLTVLYHPRNSLSALFKQMVRYGPRASAVLTKAPGIVFPVGLCAGRLF